MPKQSGNDPYTCGSDKKSERHHRSQHEETLLVSKKGETLISLRAPPPATGIDDASDNPLSRATRNLLQNGQRFERIVHTELMTQGASAARWLGIFVVTSAGRLVFFPGFAQRYDRIACGGDGKGNGKFDKAFVLDHITLESDLRTWHFTSHQKRPPRQRAGATADVGCNRVLWFGMTICRLEIAREMKSLTIARAKSPPNDAEVRDRIACFCNAVNGGQAARLQIPSRPSDCSVLHLCFVVASPEAPLYTGPNLAVAADFVTSTSSTSTSLEAISSKVKLEDREIQILAMWLPIAKPKDLFEGAIFATPG
jgi:hypothetical protein